MWIECCVYFVCLLRKLIGEDTQVILSEQDPFFESSFAYVSGVFLCVILTPFVAILVPTFAYIAITMVILHSHYHTLFHYVCTCVNTHVIGALFLS